jgi:spermidine synthase
MDVVRENQNNTSGAVARAESERGELILRRREDDGALELRVNGVFVMDTVHTYTERLLAAHALDALSNAPLRVLIGGLGLGFTLREVLADDRVVEAHVVEIEPALVAWHRDGLVPDTAPDFLDRRVRVSVGDVVEVVADLGPEVYEAMLLDIDNGPGYLVYDANTVVYQREFLRSCRDCLQPGGIVAIWSSSASPGLAGTLREVFTGVEERVIPVVLGAHGTTYHLYLGRRGAHPEE